MSNNVLYLQTVSNVQTCSGLLVTVGDKLLKQGDFNDYDRQVILTVVASLEQHLSIIKESING